MRIEEIICFVENWTSSDVIETYIHRDDMRLFPL